MAKIRNQNFEYGKYFDDAMQRNKKKKSNGGGKRKRTAAGKVLKFCSRKL